MSFQSGFALLGTSHCMYGVLKTKVKSVNLPSVPDLFTDTLENLLGVFSYDHWFFATDSSDDFIEEGLMSLSV